MLHFHYDEKRVRKYAQRLWYSNGKEEVEDSKEKYEQKLGSHPNLLANVLL